MIIFVRNLLTRDYSVLTMKVEPSDTIASVMAKVEDKLDVPPILQRFMFNGKSLHEYTPGTLADHKVVECSTLHAMNSMSGWHELEAKTLERIGIAIDNDRVALTQHDIAVGYIEEKESAPPLPQPQVGEKMRIYVKDYVMPGYPRRFTLQVEASDTVASVMAQVQHRRGYPPAMQRLRYGGQELSHDSGRTLEDYNVRKDSMLELSMDGEFAAVLDKEDRKRKKQAKETDAHDDKTTAHDDDKAAAQE